MYGKKLKELRKLKGWTQEEVAKKVKVSKQTYSHYENEQRKPSLDTIRELAAVYQVDIDEIFSTNNVEDSQKQFLAERIKKLEKEKDDLLSLIDRYKTALQEIANYHVSSHEDGQEMKMIADSVLEKE